MKFKIAYRKKDKSEYNIKDFPNRNVEILKTFSWRDYIISIYIEKKKFS